MKNRKRLILIPICIAAFFAVVYAAGVIVFSGRMLPESYISNLYGEFDVSGKTARTVGQILKMDEACPYRIYREEGGEFSFTLEDVKKDAQKTIDAAEILRAQPIYSWPFELFGKKHIYHNGSLMIDEKKLDDYLETSAVCEGEPSQDAYITVDEQGGFSVVREVYGTQVNRNMLRKRILKTIDEGKTELKITKDLYIKPAVTEDSEEISERYKNIMDHVGRTLTIDMFDAEEEISVGYFYDTDKILKDNEFVLEQEKVDEYMTYLYDNYDTFGKPHDFIDHKGEKIQVGAAGDSVADTYGFSMNQEETRKALETALEDTSVTNVEAVWNQVGNARDENGDIGGTYIEISIDEQHLWYYRDGELVLDADVVTGLPTPNKHTPKGIFTLFWKDTNTRLRGSMGSERWDVVVDYWMSVTYTGVGIHTAPWQASFGGDAYTYRGSHGCINVSNETGKALYDSVDVNTCVIIY